MASNTTTASAEVLGTYELLEHILLHVPLRTLLLSRRVNKAFLDVATRSQDIQRALFLRPAGETVAFYEDVQELDGGPPLMNSSLFKTSQWRTIESSPVIKPLLNPFLILDIKPENVHRLLSTSSGPALSKQPNHRGDRPHATVPWYANRKNLERNSVPDVEGFALQTPDVQISGLAIRQGSGNISTITGTQAAMLISQPPPRSMRINPTLLAWFCSLMQAAPNELHIVQQQLALENDTTNLQGITLRDILELVHETKPKSSSDTVDEYKLEGIDQFHRLSRTVDEITGWEMLELFAVL